MAGKPLGETLEKVSSWYLGHVANACCRRWTLPLFLPSTSAFLLDTLLTPLPRSQLNAEQLGQLYELMQATREVWKPVTDADLPLESANPLTGDKGRQR